MADNDIVIKFKKEEGNIFLESINDSGIEQSYDSSLPLLKINDGTYSKVENPDLNKIISSSVQPPVNEKEVDDDFDYSDVYNTNEVLEGKPPTNTDVLPSTTEEAPTNEVVAEEAPTNEVVAEEVPTNEVVAEEAPTNEVVAEEAPSNEVAAEEAVTTEGQSNEVVVKAQPKKNDLLKQMTLKEQLENNKLFKKIQENNKLKEGGRKTKKSKKGGNKKTKRVRFIMTRKGRKNRKNKTRR